MDRFAYSSVKDLSNLIKKRELSPVELMESVISRIEKRNKDTNAFIHLAFDEARERARIAEKQIMEGKYLGPLHGIPTAIKDLFDFKPGWPATYGGIPALKDHKTDFYCVYAEKMEQAGAIIVGKTNSPIMGFRGTCDNPLFGPTRNPFDLSKNSGGSSGGSAAAVADGLVPIAEGTDGGGSIRIPSSWSGLFGYQPSFGIVPMVMRPNAFGGTSPFVYEGPITRTVEDAAIGMTALTGYNSSDPLSTNQQIDFMTALHKPMTGWKIAYSPDFDVYPVDPRIQEVVGNAIKLFEEAGAHVEKVTFGIKHDQMELSNLWCRMIMQGSIGAFEGFKQQEIDLLNDYRDDFPPEFIYWLEHAYKIKMTDIIRDQTMRTDIFDAIQNVLNNYDLIITPTVASLPVENEANGKTKGPTHINGIEVNPLIGWCMTYFTNFTGHPAASIPAGLIDNLPVGMQIIGNRFADQDVFTASSIFEQLKPWHQTYDICRDREINNF
ncbi:amidase [Pseudogracilibacillus sp. SE30717A]|uniref:amidase n=1 Tax=Pseudogracilibacillus sp. SE30717A TaxID=3098293 RepID=UPI00300E51E5